MSSNNPKIPRIPLGRHISIEGGNDQVSTDTDPNEGLGITAVSARSVERLSTTEQTLDEIENLSAETKSRYTVPFRSDRLSISIGQPVHPEPDQELQTKWQAAQARVQAAGAAPDVLEAIHTLNLPISAFIDPNDLLRSGMDAKVDDFSPLSQNEQSSKDYQASVATKASELLEHQTINAPAESSTAHSATKAEPRLHGDRPIFATSSQKSSETAKSTSEKPRFSSTSLEETSAIELLETTSNPSSD